MLVKIKNIKKKIDSKTNKAYIIVYFDYGDYKDSFTYLTQKSLKYWKNRGVDKIKKGMEINVFRVKDTKYFKIVEMRGLE